MNLWNARHRLFDAIFKRRNTKTEDTATNVRPVLKEVHQSQSQLDKIVILDVDDTVLQWYRGFLNSPVNHKFLANANLPYCGKSRRVWDDAINDFNSSPQFGELESVDGAKEFVHRILSCGYQIVFLSACGTSDTIYDRRVENLCNVLDLTENDFALKTLPVHASKVDAVKRFTTDRHYDVALFVDDMKHHCDEIKKLGVRSVLFMGSIYTDHSWVGAWHCGVNINDTVYDKNGEYQTFSKRTLNALTAASCNGLDWVSRLSTLEEYLPLPRCEASHK